MTTRRRVPEKGPEEQNKIGVSLNSKVYHKDPVNNFEHPKYEKNSTCAFVIFLFIFIDTHIMQQEK